MKKKLSCGAAAGIIIFLITGNAWGITLTFEGEISGQHMNFTIDGPAWKPGDSLTFDHTSYEQRIGALSKWATLSPTTPPDRYSRIDTNIKDFFFIPFNSGALADIRYYEVLRVDDPITQTSMSRGIDIHWNYSDLNLSNLHFEDLVNRQDIFTYNEVYNLSPIHPTSSDEYIHVGQTQGYLTLTNIDYNSAPQVFPEFMLPVESITNSIYLNTAPGGEAFDGILDPNHFNSAAYYSIDLDINKESDPSSLNYADIVAAADGIVVDVDIIDNYSLITLYHGEGYFTEYAEFFDNIPDLSVTEGDEVLAGQKLGTLYAKLNDHLHFQVKYNDAWESYETNFDTQKYLRDYFGTGLSLLDTEALYGVKLDGKYFYDYIITDGGQAPIQQPVPEPATMLLFGTGITGLSIARLRIRRKKHPKNRDI